jgi:hypothetical protein
VRSPAGICPEGEAGADPSPDQTIYGKTQCPGARCPEAAAERRPRRTTVDGPVTLWRRTEAVTRGVAEIECTVEHLGEGLFELCVSEAGRRLSTETFGDTGALLRRAEELRKERAGVVV